MAKKAKTHKGTEWRHVENKKLVYTVYFVLRLSVVGMLIAQIFNRNFENVLLCVLTLGIGYLWLTPYQNAAEAAFYLEVTGRADAMPRPDLTADAE